MIEQEVIRWGAPGLVLVLCWFLVRFLTTEFRAMRSLIDNDLAHLKAAIQDNTCELRELVTLLRERK